MVRAHMEVEIDEASTDHGVSEKVPVFPECPVADHPVPFDWKRTPCAARPGWAVLKLVYKSAVVIFLLR
jgi:hypothetical protein